MQQCRELKGDAVAGAFMFLTFWASLSRELRLTKAHYQQQRVSAAAAVTWLLLCRVI